MQKNMINGVYAYLLVGTVVAFSLGPVRSVRIAGTEMPNSLVVDVLAKVATGLMWPVAVWQSR